MGIGISLLLVAAGIILVWATTYTVIGWIVLGVGAFGLLVALAFLSSLTGPRRETVVHKRY